MIAHHLVNTNIELKAPISMILEVSGLSSSAWYDIRPRKEKRAKPGIKPMFSDAEVIQATEAYLEKPLFYGEGYIKLRKRIKEISGVCVKKDRFNKLLRINNLLARPRLESNPANRKHDGKIITDTPDKMWATDIKEFKINGKKHYFIGIIDHFNDEIHGWSITDKADKFNVLEPLYQAILKRFGCLEKDVCTGLYLYLRSDNGSQFISKIYSQELKYYGVIHSKAFVNSPECNGIIERFHRTLNEQVLNGCNFKNIDEAKKTVQYFIDNYNQNWICHRLGLSSPIAFRKKYEEKQQSFSSYNSVYDVPVDLEINFKRDLREGKIYSKSIGKAVIVDNLNRGVNNCLKITYINGG